MAPVERTSSEQQFVADLQADKTVPQSESRQRGRHETLARF